MHLNLLFLLEALKTLDLLDTLLTFIMHTAHFFSLKCQSMYGLNGYEK